MTESVPIKPCGLGATLHDAVALADGWGAGSILGIGSTLPAADILAPEGVFLQPREALAALSRAAPHYIFTFGNQRDAPAAATLAPVMETLIDASGAGFMAACFAFPTLGRTVFQGHLFQAGALKENLLATFGAALSGRVGLVPHDIAATGATAIRARLAALKDQGYALALVDAVDEAQCTAIATAFAGLTLTAGPAWISPRDAAEASAEPPGRVAILSGALDRQTLFQAGAAASTMPVLQLDFAKPGADIIAEALAWAARQDGSYVIAASAPPDRVHRDAPASLILGEIASGLAAAGAACFLLTGNDSAAAILRCLGMTQLETGGRHGLLRALRGQSQSGAKTIFIKPSGAGGRNLFLDQIEPHNRLNAAAE